MEAFERVEHPVEGSVGESGWRLKGYRGVSERSGRKVRDLPSRVLGDELELRRMGMGRFGMLPCQLGHEYRKRRTETWESN